MVVLGLLLPEIGFPDLLIILVIFVMLFGATKLPQTGAALGKSIRNFKKAMSGEEDDDIDVTPKKKKTKAIAASSDEDAKDDATEVDEDEEDASVKAAAKK